MNLFYVNPDDIRGSSVVIDGQEAIHISKVLRHSVGDQILVTDGMGKGYECKILEIKKKSVYLDILTAQSYPKPKQQVTLCMGIIKKRDRLEFAVEKAVELGVAKIILFDGEYSQKGNVREDRLETTAISAMKQSLRFHLPDIFIEETLVQAFSSHAQNGFVIVADETKRLADEEKKSGQHFFVVVGPEGGFSKSEREYLDSIHPQYYSLGEKRLRAETAAIIMVDRFANPT